MLIQRKWFAFAAISILIFSSLACNLATGISSEKTAIPVPTEDPAALETQVSGAISTAVSGGRITLELTEGQLTAAANEELQTSGEDRIQDLQVQLDDGVMVISGEANQNGMNLPLSISVKINVDSQGKPHTQIVSGKLGPFSLPETMLAQITTQFDQMLQSQLSANAESLFVESISIDNGVITIVAQIQ